MTNTNQIEIRNIQAKPCKRGGTVIPGRIEQGQHAVIETGSRIVLWGVDRNCKSRFNPYRIEFKIGDSAVYDSYNLTYTGTIEAIGPKTVTIRNTFGKLTRLSIYEFNWRNKDFDAAKIFDRNAEMMVTL